MSASGLNTTVPMSDASRKEPGLGWAARTLIMTLGMLVGFTLFSSPTNAQTVLVLPGSDPHELLVHFEKVSAYGISSEQPDRLEVWACNTSRGNPSLRVNPAQLVRQFEAVAPPYFAWLSENQYKPEFVVGGTVTVANDTNCLDTVTTRSRQSQSSQSQKKITGVIIMADTKNVTWRGIPAYGYATLGIVCNRDEAASCTWPRNGRYTVLRSNRSNLESSAHTLLHEMGHMLGFPHSFNADEPGGEYNNRMDVMSAGRTVNTGTLAINRYSSRWISADRTEVIPVREGSSQLDAPYYLERLGQPELQMLVLPVKKGVFYTLGARQRSGRDTDIPIEGVEVYRIDQFGCDKSSPVYKYWKFCIALTRRTEPFVAAERSGSEFGQVYRKGEVIKLEDAAWNTQVWIRVLEQTEAGYMVWVGSGPVRSGPLWQGRFLDDEGSIHEKSINKIAAAGITEGCDRGRYGRGPHQFCPQDKVTRAQMVAFLARALGRTATTDDSSSTASFSDVNPGDWYAGHLNALGSIASGYPDGTFRPSQLITRGEMAIMLNRALALDANGARNPMAFADVPAGTELATAVANLAAADITSGCVSKPEPLFCPDEPLSRAQMASFLVRSPISLDDDDDDDEEEVRPDGREVRISVGDPSTRCPRGVTCWGLHRDYHYEYSGDFGPGPYTLECWINDQLAWSGTWSGRSSRGCYSWGSGQTVYVVVDGVESNKLLWAQPDVGAARPDGREVRISVGDPSTRCPQGVTCSGLHRDYRYELIGDFDSAPYTLECWVGGSRRWSGIWSGRSARGCYMWGDGGETVYVVVDGVKSNELRWPRADDEEVRPDDEEPSPDGREVEISWGPDLSRDPNPTISGWCSGYVFCRAFNYELTGLGSAPYSLECWVGGIRRWSGIWSGSEYPERGCWVKGNRLIEAYVVVDGVKSNELRWTRADGEEVRPDDEEPPSDGREVEISWGPDLSRDPNPTISGWCSGYVFCRAFNYELTGLGSAPYSLECWVGGIRRWSGIWSGSEYPERGCWVKGNRLIEAYVVVDGVKSNELRWTRADDGEPPSDGREVRISGVVDLSRDPDPEISGECSGFLFCKAFSYELIGDFGPGPHTLECWVGTRSWDPYPFRGREGCRARGNHLIEAYVVVDGVKSNELRWSRPG